MWNWELMWTFAEEVADCDIKDAEKVAAELSVRLEVLELADGDKEDGLLDTSWANILKKCEYK